MMKIQYYKASILRHQAKRLMTDNRQLINNKMQSHFNHLKGNKQRK